MDVFPIEIIEEILRHLKPPILTTYANEADTKAFYDAWNWWSPRPVFSKDEEEKVSAHLERECLYLGYENVMNRLAGDPRRRYLEILPLRLVNKTFCDLCTPFVYQEMTLLDWADDTTFYVANQYGRHVHSLRIMVKDYTGANEDSHPEDRLLQIISLCPEIQSIAFYYFQSSLPIWLNTAPDRMMTSVLHLERLNTVSIYLMEKLNGDVQRTRLITRQVEAIAQSNKVTNITHLNISIPLLFPTIYDSLLSKYTSLELFPSMEDYMPFA